MSFNLYRISITGSLPFIRQAYDFSRVPLYRSNHRISAVKGLEHEEVISASRLPQQSVARNIATRYGGTFLKASKLHQISSGDINHIYE